MKQPDRKHKPKKDKPEIETYTVEERNEGADEKVVSALGRNGRAGGMYLPYQMQKE